MKHTKKQAEELADKIGMIDMNKIGYPLKLGVLGTVQTKTSLEWVLINYSELLLRKSNERIWGIYEALSNFVLQNLEE